MTTVTERSGGAPEDHAERPLGELLSALAKESSTLVHQEVELAKAELNLKLDQMVKGGASLVVGGTFAFAGFLALLMAIGLLLVAAGIDAWLSALIVAIVAGAIGLVLVQRARAKLESQDMVPRRAMRQAKETVESVKEGLS